MKEASVVSSKPGSTVLDKSTLGVVVRGRVFLVRPGMKRLGGIRVVVVVRLSKSQKFNNASEASYIYKIAQKLYLASF